MNITIFGSSTANSDSRTFKDAEWLGRQIGQQNWKVKSGGYQGIMNAISQGVKNTGGMTIGVLQGIFGEETASKHLDKIIYTDSYQQRFRELFLNTDVFIAFEGGKGTLAEVTLVLYLQETNQLPNVPLITVGKGWEKFWQFTKMDNYNAHQENVESAFQFLLEISCG